MRMYQKPLLSSSSYGDAFAIRYRYFAKYRGHPVRFLEIGIQSGGTIGAPCPVLPLCRQAKPVQLSYCIHTFQHNDD